jgi:ATP-dependent DNA helicase RecG
MIDIETFLANGENSYIEFKERFGNPVAVAEEIVALLNFRGGSIYWGISDAGELIGITDDVRRLEEQIMNICHENILPPIIPAFEIIKLEQKTIVKITVTEGLEKPYRTKQGKYLIRTGSTKRQASREELSRLFQNSLICHNDDRGISGTSAELLDYRKLQQYFAANYDLDSAELPDTELQQLLLNASVLTQAFDSMTVSLVGLLFFAKTDIKPFAPRERFLPHTGVMLVHYADEAQEELLDRFQTYETYPEIIESVLHKIKINWWQRSHIKGLKREETTFPEKVFRELLVNALVHRDYSIHTNVFVTMFPQKVEVLSPGRLVNTVTIDKMKAGISIPRNPLIMKFMENYRYADKLGRGIPMILNYVRRTNYLDIQLQEEDEQFRVTLSIHPFRSEKL